MKHLGDITKLKGSEVPLTDIVVGGSPCQDLSVAGKRAGLAGARSGLFMEQIRLIKEMRENDRKNGRTDEHIRPRYMVWENVPGAFSSNKGEDFRAVLEETAKVAEGDACIPRLEKWPHAGCIMGDGWSLAWRLHDAQFWGVPQRRKRIALVADFGGDTAPEILFERKSLSGNTEESGKQGEGAAADVGSGIEETIATQIEEFVSAVNKDAKHQQDLIQSDLGVARTLAPGTHASGSHLTKTLISSAISFQERAEKPGGGKGILIQNAHVGCLSTLNNQSVCAFEPGAASRLGGYCWEDKAGTLRANAGDNQQAVVYGIGSYPSHKGDGTAEDVERGVGEAIGFTNRGFESGKVTETLRSEPHGAYPMVAYDEGGVACGKTGVTCLNDQGGSVMGVSENVTVALRAQEHGHQPAVCYGISSYESNAMKSANPHSGIYEADTSRTLDLNGGNPACNQGGMAVVQGADVYNGDLTGDVAATLTEACGGTNTSGAKVVCIEGNGSRPSHKGDGYAESDVMYTLNVTEHHAVAYRKTSHAKSAEDGQGWAETEVNDTLNAFDSGETRTPTVVLENHPQDNRVKISEDGNVPMVMEEPYNATTGSFMRAGNSGIAETLAARDYKDPQIVCNSVVRRLTPLECERLQGYPDGWTDIGDWTDSKGKKHKGESDAPRYKALGNSIALPFWEWMAERMVAYLGEESTMASLFSGIGGFELVFSRAGCKPIWNSEIESFPEAVTRIHFGDDEKGVKGDYEKYL